MPPHRAGQGTAHFFGLRASIAVLTLFAVQVPGWAANQPYLNNPSRTPSYWIGSHFSGGEYPDWGAGSRVPNGGTLTDSAVVLPYFLPYVDFTCASNVPGRCYQGSVSAWTMLAAPGCVSGGFSQIGVAEIWQAETDQFYEVETCLALLPNGPVFIKAADASSHRYEIQHSGSAISPVTAGYIDSVLAFGNITVDWVPGVVEDLGEVHMMNDEHYGGYLTKTAFTGVSECDTANGCYSTGTGFCLIGGNVTAACSNNAINMEPWLYVETTGNPSWNIWDRDAPN